MDRFNDIAAELPAPRDDEPPSLRTDIIDELTDHLQSAFHRELHTRTTDADPESARRRVLRRFGNPCTIARRLWYDAMQERIMSQRIATGSAVVAAVACLGMFVFLWQSTAANRAMLLQTQELVLSLSAGQAGNNAPAEWNQLQIQCVSESETGPPMEGVDVTLEGATEYTFDFPTTTLTTDARGLVDFGRVHYGQYAVRLAAPNGLKTIERVSVRPGQDTRETYVCPGGDGLAEVRIEPDLGGAVPPDELSGRIWYRFVLRRYHFDISSWKWPDFPTGDWSRPLHNEYQPETHNWVVAPDGRVISIDGPVAETALPTGPLAGMTDSIWKLPQDAGLQEVLRVEPGWYEVGFAAICVADENDPTGRTLLQILNPGGEEPSYRGPRHPGTQLPKVLYGQNNELSIPVPTKTLAMLQPVLESAPAMEVVMLRARSFSTRPDSTYMGRVAFALSALDRRPGSSEPQLPDPLLTGVEVISCGRDREWPGPGQMRELRVLLTPEERAILSPIDRTLYVGVVDPKTERTSLDPAVKAELREQLAVPHAEAT